MHRQSKEEKLAKLDELRKMWGLDNLDEEGGIDKQNKLRMLRGMDEMMDELDDIGGIDICSKYCPPGVKRVLASGTDAWIGEVDSSTVMKYPKAPGGDMTRLVTERKFLEVVGHHERIIALKGYCDTGIYLERAINGNLLDYMLESENPSPSLQQRLSWCQEAIEAVVWIHSKSVLHRDIQPSNLLLDEGLHVKLADFQGQHLSEDGTTLLDGWTAGSCRFSCPSDDLDVANVKTDLFGLGCTIYFIMMGHAVFPDIIDGEDGYPAKVEDRFARQQFPQDTHACSSITLKCWQKEYESASELLLDLKAVREGVSNTACT